MLKIAAVFPFNRRIATRTMMRWRPAIMNAT